VSELPMKTHRPPNLIAAALACVLAITSTHIAQAQRGLRVTEEK